MVHRALAGNRCGRSLSGTRSCVGAFRDRSSHPWALPFLASLPKRVPEGTHTAPLRGSGTVPGTNNDEPGWVEGGGSVEPIFELAGADFRSTKRLKRPWRRGSLLSGSGHDALPGPLRTGRSKGSLHGRTCGVPGRASCPEPRPGWSDTSRQSAMNLLIAPRRRGGPWPRFLPGGPGSRCRRSPRRRRGCPAPGPGWPAPGPGGRRAGVRWRRLS